MPGRNLQGKQSPETRALKKMAWDYLDEWLSRNKERRFASQECHDIVADMKRKFNHRGYYAMHSFGTSWTWVHAIPYHYDHKPALQDELFGVTDAIQVLLDRTRAS